MVEEMQMKQITVTEDELAVLINCLRDHVHEVEDGEGWDDNEERELHTGLLRQLKNVEASS